MFPVEEYAERQAGLADALSTQNIDLAVVTHLTDILYLSGTCTVSYLFMKADSVTWLAARRGGERARTETALPVEDFSNSAQFMAAINTYCPGPVKRMGLAFDVVPYDYILRLHKLFPQTEMVDLGPVLRNLRLIKSPREIEFLRLAGRQADGAFKTAVSLLRVGQSELELAIRIEAYMRRKGHPGVLRVRRAETEIGMGVIMAGSSVPAQPEFDSLCFGRGLSPAVPFGPGDREIHAGEAVLFDYCGCCAGYLVDQSRMLSPGKPPDEASWAYEAMRQVLRRVEERLEPGQETGKLYEIACREAKMLGYEDQFMGSDRTRLTFVGHGVGLELDEPPFIAKGRKEILAPGMTMAIEPKVLLPGIGVVGIENTYLVTANGFERLTAAGEEWREVPLD